MRNNSILAATTSLAIASLFACSGSKEPRPNTPTEAPQPEYLGIHSEWMDQTVAPCENFFSFACGKWQADNPVPETESKWSSFNEVMERNNTVLHHILDSAVAADAEQGTNLQKLGDFHYCVMDSAKLEADAFKPIEEHLTMIDNMTKTDLPKVLATLHNNGIGSAFGLFVGQDDKNSDQYITYVFQGGLGLPDRDYYFNEDERSAHLRDAYVQCMLHMLESLETEPQRALPPAGPVFEFEKQLASNSLTRVQRRDPERTYNKMTSAELQELMPDFDWNAYLSFRDFPSPEAMNLVLDHPDFFAGLNAQLAKMDLEELQAYLKWNLLRATAPRLHSDIANVHFEFYKKELSGYNVEKPRWKRSLSDINDLMGEVLGQEFVKLTFDENTKKRLDGMVDNLMIAFEERLNELDWMSDETKAAAREKLGTFSRKLGYPKKWKDYSNLQIGRESWVANYFACANWASRRNIAKLGQPIDRTEWGMAPQIVNAYYSPSKNEIVFPAGILQPPFLDPQRDDASLYAGIGAVIGHEITHGFDDQGSKFDGSGNLNKWWNDQDFANFEVRAQQVVSQFNAFEPLEGLHIDGELTLGENIADLGGVAMAYQAYQKSLEGKERKDIDGFSPEQRFFIAYAQIWKCNYTDKAMEAQVRTNPHSPGEYRVNGPLANMPQFYEAFTCTEGQPMVRPDSLRVAIW